MFEAQTISVSIRHPRQALYEAIWHPTYFPRWASGLACSTLEQEGSRWKAQGPEGTVRICFTGRNEFGVMDHYVDAGAGQEVYIPMRVIPNADGAQVLLTLFRQPGMTDEKFTADVAWVEKDLQVLKSLFDAVG